MRVVGPNMAQCETCGCPIQPLPGSGSMTERTALQLALEAHANVVHPERMGDHE